MDTKNISGDNSQPSLSSPMVSTALQDSNNAYTYEMISDLAIPCGYGRAVIKQREKIIKRFYAKWCAEHPDKQIWNKHLGEFIKVKFLSINETYAKAARSYESTLAVFRLTEVLSEATLVEEKPVKPKVKNQKSFEKMMLMLAFENIKLTVGRQRSNGELVQYCITSIK
ncbi:MAG: hypothetical protein KBT15_06625 [Bacteroidales bacterium]|nr:hypothetical protein [Candidatus Minthousia equi]